MVLGVDGLVGDFGIAEIAAKRVLKVVDTGLDVRLGSLQKGLNRTVWQIANVAGQIIAAGDSLGRIAKPNTLHAAFKNDMFRSLSHNFKSTDYTDDTDFLIRF